MSIQVSSDDVKTRVLGDFETARGTNATWRPPRRFENTRPPARVGRFEVLGVLGVGGIGLVYEGVDLESGERVALKTVPGVTGESLYRLKQEFRALADVRHPNLVQLRELITEQGEVYVAMELLEGEDFAQAVCRRSKQPESSVRSLELCVQLVAGVAALHSVGLVHRDIKSANVLVTPNDRVVVLDFGLVCDIAAARRNEVRLEGTPAYFAPELLSGGSPSEASDWYSVGVLLYQALEGSLPFSGTAYEMFIAKLEGASAPMRSGPDHVLRQLAHSLMANDPAQRPLGSEILSMLGRELALPQSRTRQTQEQFFGRASELRQIRDMAAFADASRCVAVMQLWGDVGIGKTAIVDRWLARAGRERRISVFRGRSYHGDRVEMSLIDTLVDDFASRLRTLTDDERQRVLGDNPHAFAELFPVLAGLPDRGPANAGTSPTSRERSAELLGESMRRFAGDGFLVIVLDDVQWADPASKALFNSLLHGARGGPGLALVLGTKAGIGFRNVRVDGCIRVGALSRRDARRVLEQHGIDQDGTVEAILEQAEGNPLFIAELAWRERHRFVGSAPVFSDARPSLERALADRFLALPRAARRLMQVIAVSPRPVQRLVALEAAGLAIHDGVLFRLLEQQRLIKWCRVKDCCEPSCHRARTAALRYCAPVLRADLERRLRRLLGPARAANSVGNRRVAGKAVVS